MRTEDAAHLSTLGVDQLLEDAVLVAQSVAPRRDVERRERVHVARSEPAETTVAETSVALGVELQVRGATSARSWPSVYRITHNVLHLEPKGLDRRVVRIFDAKVEQRVVETGTRMM